jgi:hypothetical protein
MVCAMVRAPKPAPKVPSPTRPNPNIGIKTGDKAGESKYGSPVQHPHREGGELQAEQDRAGRRQVADGVDVP